MFHYFSSFIIFIFIILNNWASFNKDILKNNPEITLSSTQLDLCPNGEVILYVTISGQLPVSVSYSVIIDGKTVERIVESNSSPLKIILKEAGDYTITKFSNQNTSVSSNMQFKVIPAKLPDAELIGGGTFCANSEIEPVQVKFSGTPPWTLTYQINNGTSQKKEFSNNLTVLLSDEGLINLRNVSDSKCTKAISDTASITLSEIPKTDLLTGRQELCPGEFAMYTTNYSTKYEYKWLVPSGGDIKPGITRLPNELPVIWNNPGNYNIELIVNIPSTGCTTDTIFFPVKVAALPSVYNGKDTVVCLDFEHELILTPSKIEKNIVYWSHTGQESFSVEINEKGTYQYIETSPLGCSDTGYINVVDKCKPEIFVPEAFTPNDDNINDMLEVFGVFYNLKLNIYNLNGELVFTSQNENHFWDGKKNGYNMPNGTYLWKATYTDENGEIFYREGHVILIR